MLTSMVQILYSLSLSKCDADGTNIGTTGGTLPVGVNGFQAFDNLVYVTDEELPPVYNYTTVLQGSTVDVTCEQNDTSPITETVLGTIPTKRGETFKDNNHVRYYFNGTESGGR